MAEIIENYNSKENESVQNSRFGIVEKEIKKPVANYLIQDKAKRGDTIQAKMTTKGLKLTVKSKVTSI